MHFFKIWSITYNASLVFTYMLYLLALKTGCSIDITKIERGIWFNRITRAGTDLGLGVSTNEFLGVRQKVDGAKIGVFPIGYKMGDFVSHD